jgi:hypothetical protein
VAGRHQTFKKKTPQLAIDSEFFHHAFANPCTMEIKNGKPMTQSLWCAPYCAMAN